MVKCLKNRSCSTQNTLFSRLVLCINGDDVKPLKHLGHSYHTTFPEQTGNLLKISESVVNLFSSQKWRCPDYMTVHLIKHRLTGKDGKVVLHESSERRIGKEEETTSRLQFIFLTVSIKCEYQVTEKNI